MVSEAQLDVQSPCYEFWATTSCIGWVIVDRLGFSARKEGISSQRSGSRVCKRLTVNFEGLEFACESLIRELGLLGGQVPVS
jgi:hypothetical protein